MFVVLPVTLASFHKFLLSPRFFKSSQMSEIFTKIQEFGLSNHPRTIIERIEYGTAGFRSKATDLDAVVFRMGLLASLRSMKLHGTVGIMVTASHNPIEDNGVKLIEPMGDMLPQSWEVIATDLANVSDDWLAATLEELMTTNGIKLSSESSVFVASDTRPSSPALVAAAINGAKLFGAEVKNFDLLTTPQLHFIVRSFTTGGRYGEPCEIGYYKKLSAAFLNLHDTKSYGNYAPDVSLDGANGVGALKTNLLLPYLQDSLKIKIFNDGTNGKLNHMCGSDYVKIQQKSPEGMPTVPNRRCVSFDGDADRIVYYYTDENGAFHLLDGDKIATLFTQFLKQLLKEADIALKLSVVQTAYANGSSTKYIENVLDVPVVCEPTGVKHLHHRAKQSDIGVYFEANGHGTVVFSDEALNQIKELASRKTDQQKSNAAQRLLNVVDVINETVGDAISDMLLIETILRSQGWSIVDWDAMYRDLPNWQMKVKVADRRQITTTDAERKCVTPKGLQTAVDQLVSACLEGRAFIRPSGTEDIVRVYAEAKTQDSANRLAYEISLLVFNMAGGVGKTPELPE